MPGLPWITASRTAATVPEWWTSAPRLPPALIPERTHDPRPQLVQRQPDAVGGGPVDRVATIGAAADAMRSVVTTWPQPERPRGATTRSPSPRWPS